MVRVTNESTFAAHMRKRPVLYCGAGFSVEAKNIGERGLPLATELAHTICRAFELQQTDKLDQAYAIARRKDARALTKLVIDELTVDKFDDLYYAIRNVQWSAIFTANVDNLIESIYRDYRRYLNDIALKGQDLDRDISIEFAHIHGSVLRPDDGFYFSSFDMVAAPTSSRLSHASITKALASSPVLFWGTSLSDAMLLSAWTGADSPAGAPPRWVVCRPDDKQFIEYCEAIGLHVIEATTLELLEYIATLFSAEDQKPVAETRRFLQKYAIPRQDSIPLRPYADFLLGDEPTWSDVFSRQTASLAYKATVIEKALKDNFVVISGVPACGKSTLLMQAAVEIPKDSLRLYFQSPSVELARVVARSIEEPCVVAIDDFAGDREAVAVFRENHHITLLVADRDYSIEATQHIGKITKRHIVDISDLSVDDARRIFDAIPHQLRRSASAEIQTRRSRSGDARVTTLFDFVQDNIVGERLRERFRRILPDLRQSNEQLDALLLMLSYVCMCGTPVSITMILSYLDESWTNYQTILDKLNRLGSIVDEAAPPAAAPDFKHRRFFGYGPRFIPAESTEDLFTLRSKRVAEAVWGSANQADRSRTLIQFVRSVPRDQIVRFVEFRRKAFDARLAFEAFATYDDGLAFYEIAEQLEKGPFLLQQMALFQKAHKKWAEAAQTAQLAVNTSPVRHESILATYAELLFESAWHLGSTPGGEQEIEVALNLLEEVYDRDTRRANRAVTYADLAMRYCSRSPLRAHEYVERARVMLDDVVRENPWFRRASHIQRALNMRHPKRSGGAQSRV